MSRAQELLSCPVKVLLRSPDSEERQMNVKICIELQTATSPAQKKELVLRLTDDTDPLFLYRLVISEEDFQSLKVQQGLLMDFSAFPQKFLDLLQQCIHEESKEVPRFLLQLSPSTSVLGGSPAQLDVVETNPFKHLIHLSLRLLPANDLEIKGFLSSCLRCIKEEKCILQQRLKNTEEDLGRQLACAQQNLLEKSRELETLRSEMSRQVTALKSQHSAEMAVEREKVQQVQARLHQQYEQQKEESESSHLRNVQQMQSRLAELEPANKDLLERRYKAESTIRELRTKYQGLEEETQRVQQEVVSLRRENSTLDAECHEKEKDLNRLQMRLAVLEQELKDKEQLVLRSNETLTAMQEQKVALDARVEKKQIHVGKLEATIKSLSAELLKANEIIKKLQGDLKGLMGKLKLKNSVTVQQEKLLAKKEKQIQEEHKVIEETSQNLRLREEEVQKLKDTLQQTEQKLEESKELLQTNENVITWLNKQLNESQSNPRNAPVRTSALPSQMPENRQFLASRIGNPLLSSYPPMSYIPSSQQPVEVQRAQYNNMLPRTNSQSSVALRGHPSTANKENAETARLDLKYLKKRDGGLPLQGLDQNTAMGTEPILNTLLTVPKTRPAPPSVHSAYFPSS
ncbi:spindle assembly abnormal protein 6 homolog [Discoglossus pictus]